MPRSPTRSGRSLDHHRRHQRQGSVTAMVHRGLLEAGHRAARYTSPHLERLEERFVIGDREVDTERLRAAIERVREAVETLQRSGALEAPPTFFECATAIAFDLFREAGVRGRRARGRPGRAARRHQRRRADRDGDHLDRLRPSGAARRESGVDRLRESRHRQAGDSAGQRRSAGRGGAGHRGHLPRARRPADPRVGVPRPERGIGPRAAGPRRPAPAAQRRGRRVRARETTGRASRWAMPQSAPG